MSSFIAMVTVVIVSSSVQTVHPTKRSLFAAGSGSRSPPGRTPQRDIQYAVEEETPIGTEIGRGLRLDTGLEDRYSEDVLKTIRFRFLNDAPSFVEFSDVSAGVLRTSGRVDREQLCAPPTGVVVSGNQHYSGLSGTGAGDLCRVKLDVAVQPMQYFEIIKVNLLIIDVNDHAPEFPDADSRYTLNIIESAPVGTEYHLPAAIDRDSIQFAVQRYVLLPQHAEFQLRTERKYDGTTDVKLVLKRTLDREIRSQYRLTLTAYDGGVPARSDFSDVTVIVLDANDNRPTFDQTSYEANILENMSPGSSVLRVRATDPDDGENGAVRYQLSAASLAHYGHVFSVENSSGDVIVVGVVDYERATVYHLIVCAVDSGSELVTSSEAVVIIKVEDVNDNAPTVTINTLTASGTDVTTVAENSPYGTFVGHVIVGDQDSGRNGRTNCSMISGSADSVFRLEQMFETEYQVVKVDLLFNVHTLVTSGHLDRESVDCYTVHFNCTDHGRPIMSTVTRLTIHISDVNDHTPRFAGTSQYVAEVTENNYVGTYVVQISAADSDIHENAAVRYVIADTADAAAARISDAWTPDRVESITDRVDRQKWSVEPSRDRLPMRDGGRRTGQNKDRKWRTRTDGKKEEQGKIQADGGMSAQGKVDGGMSVQGKVDGGMSAQGKADGGMSVQGKVDGGMSAQGKADGGMSVQGKVDGGMSAQGKADGGMSVQGKVDGGMSVQGKVYGGMSVQGKVDGGMSVQGKVDGGMSAQGKADGGMSVQGKVDGGMSAQGKADGGMSVQGKVDGGMSAQGKADGGMSAVQGKVDGGMSTQGKADGGMSAQGKADGGMLVQGKAVLGNECWSSFNVDSSSGMITAKVSFDYETTSVLHCYLLAIDNGTPSRTGEAELIVNIIDVNDERPIFQQSEYVFYVREHLEPFSVVGTVTAVDRDAPPYNSFSFSFHKSNSETENFVVEPQTGKILTRRQLDRETQSVYHIIVIASDTQEPRALSSTALVVIHVEDINDNAPVFIRPFRSLNGHIPTSQLSCYDDLITINDSRRVTDKELVLVPHSALAGSTITRLEATDADSENNAKVTYQLHTSDPISANMFRVDADLGTILLASTLTPRDINATYHVTVTASDSGLRRLSASVDLCIRVVERTTVDDQLRPAVVRQGNRLLSQMVFSRSMLVGVVLPIIVCTASVLLAIACLIRRANARRRRRFADDKKAEDDIGNYNCRVAAAQYARNGNKYPTDDDPRWSQPDQRTTFMSDFHPDCLEEHPDNVYKAVLEEAVEPSGARIQANGSCRRDSTPSIYSNTITMTSFSVNNIHQQRQKADSPQQQLPYETQHQNVVSTTC